jgi:transcription elongation GreA/GreB family factor
MGTVIAKEVYQYLAKHAWELQDNKISRINMFAADFDDYMSLLNYINSYIGRIENYLDTAKTGEGPYTLPFVILGSVVQISEQISGRILRFRIVIPDKKLLENGMNADVVADVINISCFSPVGSALLFKEVDEEVSIEAEDKKLDVKIDRIDFDTTL